jgi:hypothetical protein
MVFAPFIIKFIESDEPAMSEMIFCLSFCLCRLSQISLFAKPLKTAPSDSDLKHSSPFKRPRDNLQRPYEFLFYLLCEQPNPQQPQPAPSQPSPTIFFTVQSTQTLNTTTIFLLSTATSTRTAIIVIVRLEGTEIHWL